MFEKLPLKKQLIALCAIFMLPLVLMTFLLARDARSDIAFSGKERSGVTYLQAVFPVMSTVAQGKPVKLISALQNMSAEHDSAMQSWAASAQFRLAISGAQSKSAKIASGAKLIKTVGDGSNLILDPDLDSYYLMDLVIAQLPALMSEVARLDDEISGSTGANVGTLTALRSDISGTRNAINASMMSALQNNASGVVAKNLMTPHSQLLSDVDTQIAIMDLELAAAQTTGKIPTSASLAIQAGNAKILASINKTYPVTLETLDILLADRISGRTIELLLSLLASLFATGLAFVLAWAVAQRLTSNVDLLSARITSLKDGDFQSPIPLQDHKNELGLIAGSLKVLRAHSQEKAKLTEQIEEERAETSQRLQRLAYLDDLTGLPNRKWLGVAMESHFATGQCDANSALLFFDLDGFKEVNDALTHVAGDQVLCEVARRLSAFVKNGDFVTRLGGDEFALFLANAGDRDSLLDFCNRIVHRLAEPYRIEAGMQFLTSSIGIGYMPVRSASDASEITRRADVAMYRAKALGKNQAVLFDPTFDAESLKRKEIEQALRESLRRGEIDVHFQPQIDVLSGKLVSVEGLARWTHPRLGKVEPNIFIPIAESAGLINQLGRHVMRQAILAVRRWPQLRVSINLSVAQLRHHQFMNDITALVGELNERPDNIELEITESVLMDNNPLIDARLQALRDMGFILALDDFGTGYSSLGYLSRFKFDRLKIDRSFVMGAKGNARGQALLKSIASMGQALGMDVCAEGVESYETLQYATEAGCTLLQGHYFSPAVSAADIDAMVHAMPTGHYRDGGKDAPETSAPDATDIAA